MSKRPSLGLWAPKLRATRIHPRLNGCPAVAQQVFANLPNPLGGVLEVHDLDRVQELFVGHSQDQVASENKDDAACGPRDAKPLAFPPSAASEGGLLGIGVAYAAAGSHGGLGCRTVSPTPWPLLSHCSAFQITITVASRVQFQP